MSCVWRTRPTNFHFGVVSGDTIDSCQPVAFPPHFTGLGNLQASPMARYRNVDCLLDFLGTKQCGPLVGTAHNRAGRTHRGGYDMAMLRLIRGDDSVSFDALFAGFSKFTSLFVTFLLYILAGIGGMLLLIVPGIILLIALWPAFLLVMEDDLAPVDAIKGAWALTRGHKMELFVLVLATFVVLMVGLLAFGVGLLIAGPITQLAWIRAYHEMRKAPEVA